MFFIKLFFLYYRWQSNFYVKLDDFGWIYVEIDDFSVKIWAAAILLGSNAHFALLTILPKFREKFCLESVKNQNIYNLFSFFYASFLGKRKMQLWQPC